MTKNEKIVVLRATVGAFCITCRPFTSVEVANHLKKIGIWIPNRIVAGFLQENVIDIAYEYGLEYHKTSIRVITDKSYMYAMCYHPRSFDPNNYMARDLKAITPDEFEGMHGIQADFDEPLAPGVPEMNIDPKGKVYFNFPGMK